MNIEVKKCEGTQSIETLVSEFRSSIDALFTHFDCTTFIEIVDRVFACTGVVFFTGVGKSGLIAQKISSTLTSAGTKAFALSAQDALHGDVGIVGCEDIVFLLSKTGETDELLSLIPALRKKGAYLIAIVSSEASRLGMAVDESFILPSVKELCPFDLVPTTSALSQLIFGDLLAAALMRQKQFSLEQFIQNHPAGRIGKRQLVSVHDLMVRGKKIPMCFPQDTLEDILVELSNKQCGCICVVDEKEMLLGIFTDGDLRRALQEHGPQFLGKQVGELMTQHPRTVSPETLAYRAMKEMEEGHPVTVLPVVEGKRCVGLIKMHDILQAGI